MYRTVTLKQSLVYSKQVGFDYFRQKRVSQSIFVAAFIYQDHISISLLQGVCKGYVLPSITGESVLHSGLSAVTRNQITGNGKKYKT